MCSLHVSQVFNVFLMLWYMSDDQLIKRVIAETSSGALLANDCLVHFTVSALPFGGVGEWSNVKFTCSYTIYPPYWHTLIPPHPSLRKQRYGLLPRPAQLRPAQPPAQLSDQAAEDGRSEQHALPASHRQEAGLGSILAAQAGQRGQIAPRGTASHAGWVGCFYCAGKYQ